MKYSQISLPKRSLDPHEAAEYLGGEALLEAYVKSKWLVPYVKRNRCTRYDLKDLDACIVSG